MAMKKVKEFVVVTPTKANFWIGLRVETWEDPETHKEKTYWKYMLPDVVQVMGITREGKVIAIGEFQPGAGDYVHLIGETMKEGETPVEAAIRGLKEEAGYTSNWSPIHLSSILENTGRSDRLIHTVLLTDCYQTSDAENDIVVSLVSPEDCWRDMMTYFRTNPESTHGGGNSLKLMTLAFEHMGWLKVEVN